MTAPVAVYALEGLAAGLSIIGSLFGARSNRRAADASVREGNRLAGEAIDRGEETARRYGIDLAQLMGRQRATLAAQGIAVDQGSAAQIAAQTTRIGEEELALIRENARREAFGLKQAGKNQALGLRAQAAGQYGQAFASVLNFGANAWQSHQMNRSPMRALPAMSSLPARSNAVVRNPYQPAGYP